MAEGRKLTNEEKAVLEALRGRPDSDIDRTDPDAPEVRDWSGAVRGALYRPVKQPVTIRLDADVLAWFKARGDTKGYQTRINAALREYIARHQHDRE
ncbi:MAG: BrnA antitoxin family protein [Magnetospirillum sp.]|nr:BrnA antitoxin family protein [Magnetospirillum sp.]